MLGGLWCRIRGPHTPCPACYGRGHTQARSARTTPPFGHPSKGGEFRGMPISAGYGNAVKRYPSVGATVPVAPTTQPPKRGVAGPAFEAPHRG